METSPQSPTGSYITEIAYPNAYHRDLNPSFHTLALHVRGIDAPERGKASSYLELGCAWGLSTLIHAAGNPAARFVGIDANPVHLAAAREIAAAAGLTNVEFVESDFAAAAGRAMDPFDTIALHGIWSWTDDAGRKSIVDLVKRHLKDDGLLFLSYNALPGNGPMDALRRLMMVGFDLAPGGALAKIESAIGLASHVKDNNAQFFNANTWVGQRLDTMIKPAPRDHLAHEYFNPNWKAFYHADVATTFANAADFLFACTAYLPDFIDEAQLTPDARRLLNSMPESTTRETLRDFFVNCMFRRDIFTRNRLPMDTKPLLMDTRFVSGHSADHFDRITGRSMMGEIRPKPEPGRAILAALAEGPASANDLAKHPACSSVSSEVLLEALMVLAAVGAAEPLSPDDGAAARKAVAQRLNLVLMERTMEACRTGAGVRWSALASPVTGGGINVDPLYQAFLLARIKGEDPIALAGGLGTGLTTDDLTAAHRTFEADATRAFKAFGLG